jgi:hypothetical protein
MLKKPEHTLTKNTTATARRLIVIPAEEIWKFK